MNCILHIGTEKTGTTTIQEFLFLNRKLLREREIIFTETLGKKNNRALPFLAYDSRRQDDFTKMQYLHDANKRTETRTRLLLQLSDELSNVPRDSSVVFSSEHLQSRLTSDEDLVRLSGILSKFRFEKIRVVVYLRNPVEGAVSLLSTTIKGNNRRVEMLRPEHQHITTVFHHKATIERWGKAFGEENIIPRIFSKDCFHDGDLIKDFIQTCEFPDLDYEIPVKKNESINLLGLELLARINCKIPVFIDRIPNKLRGNLHCFFERHFTGGDTFGPTKAMVKEYEDYFGESNEWVRRRFFPERSQLFCHKNFGNVSSNIQSETLDQIANLISDIWIKKQREVMSQQPPAKRGA